MQIEKTTFKFLKVKTEANCGKEKHTEIKMSLDLGFFPSGCPTKTIPNGN